MGMLIEQLPLKSNIGQRDVMLDWVELVEYGEEGVYHVVFSYMEEESGSFRWQKHLLRNKQAGSVVAGEDYRFRRYSVYAAKLRECKEKRLGHQNRKFIMKKQNPKRIPCIRLE